MNNKIKSLPMVALRGMTIMPEMVVHFDVSRERSIAAIQEAMVEEQKIFLTAQKSIDTENPGMRSVQWELSNRSLSCRNISCVYWFPGRREDGFRRWSSLIHI